MPTRGSKPSTYLIPSFSFIGEMATGKGTYCDHLKEQIEREFGIPVYRFSFSAKIVEIAKDLFGMEGKDRKLLQNIGNKMREIDPDVWAGYIVRDIKANGKVPFAVDGIRTPNEAAVFKRNFANFIIIRLEVDGQQRMEVYKKNYGRYPTGEESNNISEKTVAGIPFDITLHNNYERANLERQVRGIVEAIKNGTFEKLTRSL